jgi:hypothetical protein
MAGRKMKSRHGLNLLFGFFRAFLIAHLVAIIPGFAQPLLEKRFRARSEAEALLDLTASASGTSWVEAGREAAAVTVLVDGRAQQDVMLFNGAQRFTYRLLLGRVPPGEHSVRITFNRKQSAASVAGVEIHDARITLVDRTQAEFAALAHAPILHARPNTIGRFSDVPLLMYYETERAGDLRTLRYTVIFSNEDGGTQTAALMARWGRTTDIEWVIETTLDAAGRIVKSEYQGINHETKTFQGQREADHPLLLTASDNNNFRDDGQSEMRFALRPIPFDPSKQSREAVMDQHPWTYRVMAEEMIREGKIISERRLGAQIADLRQYLYIDAASNQQNGSGLSFAVKLKGDGRWFTSDQGVSYNKIERSGFFRTTVRLPAKVAIRDIERIAVRCDVLANPKSPEETKNASASSCDLQSVNKAFLLDQQFQPASALQFRVVPLKLQFGEMIELELRPR